MSGPGGSAGSVPEERPPVSPERKPPAAPDVKICGCRTPADARAAVEAGATHVGVVFADSPRRVTVEEAVEIVEAAGGARAVGVFVDASPEEVLAAAGASGIEVAQLHGRETPEACAALREVGLEVWKALRPRSAAELEAGVERYRDAADAILVEGFSPAAAGGTGSGFPLAWLERARDRLTEDGPALVLAGGLTSENVAAAILEARPDVVDVSSGVERRPGRKDPERIRAFVKAARMERSSGAGAAGRPEAGDQPEAEPAANGTGT